MNTSQPNSRDLSKKLEYAKQQQQLRAFGNVKNTTSSKPLSAESMIEDLLSKKETFQKRNPENQQKQETPSWLIGAVHPLYERVWSGVLTANGLADTPLLSKLLMSSGLSTDTLGYIWSLANRIVPGALTQPELYMVLALVGLAQTGYVVNNIAALHQLPQAPVPTLDLSLLPTQVSGPHVYPNPLNVTSLPDPLTFNWASSETVYPSSSEKIGISYVSSGPMVIPKLLTDQISQSLNPNLTELNIKNNITEQNTIYNNLPLNSGFDSANNIQLKNSPNTYSFSFPSLSESPSRVVGVKPEDTDPFDDEFADFQSADITSTTVSVQNEKHSDFVIDDEDEFSNFQKASPQYDNDDLSVLVIGGRNIPSAQQLWVTDSPSVYDEKDKVSRTETKREGMFNVSDTLVSDKSADIMKPVVGFETKDQIENKYDVFQEIDDDKFSVFHNPLPDDDDKQSIASGSAIENVHIEAKSIFNHSLFNDQEPSLDLFKTIRQPPTFELPTFPTDSHHITDDGKEDEEYSNFQTFTATFSEQNFPVENVDKYDVFRTVFEDSAFKSEILQLSTPQEPPKENIMRIESVDTETDVFCSSNYNQNEDGHALFGDIGGKQNNNDFKFGDFKESVILPSSKNSNIDNLFSSLSISDKFIEKDIQKDSSLVLDNTVDKYKALRLLEPESVETDEFGEFLGAELPNPGNEPQKYKEQPSIQIRCLEACLNLLKSGLSTLSRTKSQEVMSEVLGDLRANTYLDCLLEIHRVSERIICHMGPDSCSVIKGELHQVWESLAPYFTHTEHNHLTESVGAVCGVCRSNTGPAPVTFGGVSFHAPCANLYLHCVEPVLPYISATLVQ